jgi:hypothetical protein
VRRAGALRATAKDFIACCNTIKAERSTYFRARHDGTRIRPGGVAAEPVASCQLCSAGLCNFDEGSVSAVWSMAFGSPPRPAS